MTLRGLVVRRANVRRSRWVAALAGLPDEPG